MSKTKGRTRARQPHDFAGYLTPEQALKKSRGLKLAELQARAKGPEKPCESCDDFFVWRLAGTGMCFTCTTGQLDASDDFELKAAT